MWACASRAGVQRQHSSVAHHLNLPKFHVSLLSYLISLVSLLPLNGQKFSQIQLHCALVWCWIKIFVDEAYYSFSYCFIISRSLFYLHLFCWCFFGLSHRLLLVQRNCVHFNIYKMYNFNNYNFLCDYATCGCILHWCTGVCGSVCMYVCICWESGNVFIHLSVFRKCMSGALKLIRIHELSAIPIITLSTFQT